VGEGVGGMFIPWHTNLILAPCNLCVNKWRWIK